MLNGILLREVVYGALVWVAPVKGGPCEGCPL